MFIWWRRGEHSPFCGKSDLDRLAVLGNVAGLGLICYQTFGGRFLRFFGVVVPVWAILVSVVLVGGGVFVIIPCK